jgi:hypothetical protein
MKGIPQGLKEGFIDELESDMKLMWELGDTLKVLEDDPEYIEVVMTAIFYERHYWIKHMGLTIGEA